MNRRLPDFMIIGAAKAGTTSLYKYLNQHPQIFMSAVKETNFFAYNGKNTLNYLGKKEKTSFFPVKTLDRYLETFAGAECHQLLGEASPLYLESPIAASRIRNLVPAAKLLASLRNPADRAFSGFLTAVRNGWARPEDPKLALAPSSHYVQAGFYFDKLRLYYDQFPAGQLKICLFDDLKLNPSTVVADMLDYLGVDKAFAPDTGTRYNTGGMLPKSFLLSLLFRHLRRFSHNRTVRAVIPGRAEAMYKQIQRSNQAGRKISFPADLRASLTALYRQDILKVQDLIRRDLSSWLDTALE